MSTTTNFGFTKLDEQRPIEPASYNANLDELDEILEGFGAADDNMSVQGTLTVGVNATGYDVNFYGDTTGKKWMWDESADSMIVTGISQFTGAVTVGVNATGHDVTFYGDTTGKSWLWDESADKMIVTGASDLLGATQVTGALTVGVNATGHDVTFYGDTTGKSFLWDESADTLIVTGGLTVTHAANFATAGLRTMQAVTNVHDTAPTQAELVTAFGAVPGRGFIGTIDDNDGNAISYIVWSSDASYYFVIGTKGA